MISECGVYAHLCGVWGSTPRIYPYLKPKDKNRKDNRMSFLNPLGVLFGLLAIPIILLYMLRLRRRDVLVSSHFLWQRLLQDNTANTPWQKLRRNLLLFLQLLILALLVLALMRPAIALPSETQGRIVVLLDASASMNTLEDGQTRWQIAQGEAQNLVRQLGVGDEMSLIWVSDTVQLLAEYTNNATLLNQAISSATVGQGGADWETALTVALGGANQSQNFSMVVLSDGSNGTLNALNLPLNVPQPRLIQVGNSSQNMAITALSIRTLPAENPQLFAQLQNYGTSAVSASLAIRLDGVLWASQEATLDANTQRAFVFEITQDFSTVQASLVFNQNSADALALDNIAWASAPENQQRTILIISRDNNRFLTEMFSTLPNVRVVQGDAGLNTLPSQPYDAYVLDGYLPTNLPSGDMLIINPPRSSELFTLGSAESGIGDINTLEATHPLMQFVEMNAINFRQIRALQSNALEPLVTLNEIGLVWAAENNGRQVAVLPFAFSDSDFPLQIAYPIFISNLMDWFTRINQLTAQTSYAPNSIITLELPLLASGAQITLPNGSVQELERNEPFVNTQALGLYRIETVQDGQAGIVQPFAINLFNPNESQIAPRKLRFSTQGEQVLNDNQTTLRELWGVFALLALLVLMLEWWLYHRRFSVRV
jgi:Ca-activated chloride channel homolog